MTRRGYTLMEMMMAVALISIVALTVSKIFSVTMKYAHSTSQRQQIQSDADSAMNTIVHALQQAKGSSVVICACQTFACTNTNFGRGACTKDHPGTTDTSILVPPNSRVDYTDIKGNSDAIYWTNYQVYMQIGSAGAPKLLANNVTGLMFSGDWQDPTHIGVTLRLDAGVSSSDKQSVLLANQIVRFPQ